jgi:hypothetical protein
MIRASDGRMGVTWRFVWAPRARFERATYCLGGRLRRGPYLRGARSAVLLGCPRVTAVHRDFPCDRARDGHGQAGRNGWALTRGAGIDSVAMREDRVDPEGCLRSLTAEALWWAHPQRPLFPVSLGVMAVANAFVMLGLLPEPVAEAILA